VAWVLLGGRIRRATRNAVGAADTYLEARGAETGAAVGRELARAAAGAARPTGRIILCCGKASLRGEEPAMSDLANRKCVPCKPGTAPLKGTAVQELARQLPDWRVVDEHHLEREWRFRDFAQALAFVNRVGAIAEQEQHHPEITCTWGRAAVRIWTHSAGGLTEADFVLAAKIDAQAAGRE
jgi:4a-hydroxytetrahydrobiopterin dehydratase